MTGPRTGSPQTGAERDAKLNWTLADETAERRVSACCGTAYETCEHGRWCWTGGDLWALLMIAAILGVVLGIWIPR